MTLKIDWRRFRAVRKLENIPIGSAAEDLGISVFELAQLERGERNNPSTPVDAYALDDALTPCEMGWSWAFEELVTNQNLTLTQFINQIVGTSNQLSDIRSGVSLRLAFARAPFLTRLKCALTGNLPEEFPPCP